MLKAQSRQAGRDVCKEQQTLTSGKRPALQWPMQQEACQVLVLHVTQHNYTPRSQFRPQLESDSVCLFYYYIYIYLREIFPLFWFLASEDKKQLQLVKFNLVLPWLICQWTHFRKGWWFFPWWHFAALRAANPLMLNQERKQNVRSDANWSCSASNISKFFFPPLLSSAGTVKLKSHKLVPAHPNCSKARSFMFPSFTKVAVFR